MKMNYSNKVMALILVGSMASFSACQQYEDDIDNLDDRIESVEGKLADLEASIKAGTVVASVVPTDNGIKVVMSDGKYYQISYASDAAVSDVWRIGDSGYWTRNGVNSDYKAMDEDGSKANYWVPEYRADSNEWFWVEYDASGKVTDETVKMSSTPYAIYDGIANTITMTIDGKPYKVAVVGNNIQSLVFIPSTSTEVKDFYTEFEPVPYLDIQDKRVYLPVPQMKELKFRVSPASAAEFVTKESIHIFEEIVDLTKQDQAEAPNYFEVCDVVSNDGVITVKLSSTYPYGVKRTNSGKEVESVAIAVQVEAEGGIVQSEYIATRVGRGMSEHSNILENLHIVGPDDLISPEFWEGNGDPDPQHTLYQTKLDLDSKEVVTFFDQTDLYYIPTSENQERAKLSELLASAVDADLVQVDVEIEAITIVDPSATPDLTGNNPVAKAYDLTPTTAAIVNSQKAKSTDFITSSTFDYVITTGANQTNLVMNHKIDIEPIIAGVAYGKTTFDWSYESATAHHYEKEGVALSNITYDQYYKIKNRTDNPNNPTITVTNSQGMDVTNLYDVTLDFTGDPQVNHDVQYIEVKIHDNNLAREAKLKVVADYNLKGNNVKVELDITISGAPAEPIKVDTARTIVFKGDAQYLVKRLDTKKLFEKYQDYFNRDRALFNQYIQELDGSNVDNHVTISKEETSSDLVMNFDFNQLQPLADKFKTPFVSALTLTHESGLVLEATSSITFTTEAELVENDIYFVNNVAFMETELSATNYNVMNLELGRLFDDQDRNTQAKITYDFSSDWESENSDHGCVIRIDESGNQILTWGANYTEKQIELIAKLEVAGFVMEEKTFFAQLPDPLLSNEIGIKPQSVFEITKGGSLCIPEHLVLEAKDRGNVFVKGGLERFAIDALDAEVTYTLSDDFGGAVHINRRTGKLTIDDTASEIPADKTVTVTVVYKDKYHQGEPDYFDPVKTLEIPVTIKASM